MKILSLSILLTFSTQILTFSQDCSTLILTTIVSSNYNGVQISCHGASDGSITSIAAGGQPPYTFSLVEFPANVSGTITGVFDGLGAGNYTVKVTDGNICESVSAPVIITSPIPLSVVASVTSNYNGSQISCFGGSDGVITTTSSGGIGFHFTLNQSPGNTTGAFSGIFSNVGAGIYTILISDANGCITNSAPVNLVEPEILTAEAEITPDQSGSDGSIVLTVTGGTSPYLYEWSNSTHEKDLLNVAAGEYDVEITDANSCMYNENFVVPIVVGITHDELDKGVVLSYNNLQQSFYLAYSLDSRGPVSIKVFDAKSGLISQHFEYQEAGEQKYNLAQQNSQPGFYVVQIKIDNKLYSKKLLIF
jgi:hypothetical protein